MKQLFIAGILGICLAAGAAFLGCEDRQGGKTSHHWRLPSKPPPGQVLQGEIAPRPDDVQKSTPDSGNEVQGK